MPLLFLPLKVRPIFPGIYKLLTRALVFIFLLTNIPCSLLAKTPGITAHHDKTIIFLSQTGNLNFPFFTPQPLTLCSGASIVIKGDTETPTPTTYVWQVLQNGTWVPAPGVTNTADYTPSLLLNNTLSPVVFDIRRDYTGPGGPGDDSYYDVTVLPSGPITNNTVNAPATTTFCSPGSPTVITGSTPAGGNGTFTFQWQSSTDNVNFTDINGATASDYTPPALTATTYYRRTVSTGSCSTPTESNTVTITILSVVTNNTITAPGVTSFCTSGDPAVITGNTPSGGNGAFTYQWQSSTDNVNFSNISGANSANFDPSTISITTYYRRSAISGACTAPVFSNVVTINILPVLTSNVITAPAVTSLCSPGSPAAITGNTPSGGSGAYTYQWQNSTDNVNFTDIPGATLSSYTPPALTATTYYRRTVNGGSCVTPSQSNTVTISIAPPLANNTITAPAVTSFCVSGDPAAITGSTPTGGSGTVAYQWQSSTDNVNFTDISGATNPGFDPPLLTATTYYRRWVTSGVCSAPVYSNVVTISILTIPTNNLITPPTVSSFCTSGDPAVITGNTPSGGNGVFTYQWQSSTDNVTFSNIAGANSANFDPPAISVTTYYRRSAVSGACTTPVNSNVVTITILPVLTNNVITAPAVTSLCSPGSPAAITGNTPSGGSGAYTYQWQSSTDNVNFTDITGATLSSYTPPALTITTYFRRTVDGGSCVTPSQSNTVTISIAPPLTNNTITPPGVTSFCISGDPSIITGSTATGGSGTVAYQWQSSTDNVNFTDISGANGSSFDPPVLSATTYYRRWVTSGVCSTPAYSNVVTITILPVLTNNVITAPTVTSLCSPGSPAAITGNTPSGGSGAYTYQWQSSTDNVNFTDIAGATSSSYTPSALTVTTYYRRIVNGGSCVTPSQSNTVTISIAPALTNNMITPPGITSFCVSGDPAIITGSTPTGGSGTVAYQWQSSTDNVNFTDIAGANGSNFDPPVLTATTYYRRWVISGVCSTPAYSNVVTISILTTPTNNVITPPAVTSFCVSGDPAAITGNTPSGGNGTFTYQWQSSTDNVTFTDISGASSPNFDPPLLTATTYYRRSASSSACTTPVFSNVVTITILPVLTNNVITAPAVTSLCSPGSPAAITGNTPSGGSGSYTYQWQSSTDNINFADIPGATLSSYTPSALTVTTYYRRTVNGGSCVTPSQSNTVTISIAPALTNNTITPPGITSFCVSGDPAIITGSTPTGGSGTVAYQWQSSTDNVNFTDISGATNPGFDPPVLSATTYYRRWVTSGVCSTPVYSNVVTISILTTLANNVITPPAVASFCVSGDPAIITGNTPSGGSGTFTYQWQSSTDNVTFSNIPGATLSSFDPPVLTTTTYYLRSASSGACATPLLSNVVTINLLPVPVAPAIAQPSVTVCPGSPATLSVNSPQTGFTYNWYDSAAKTNLLFTGVTYVTAPLTANQTYYIESSNGACTSASMSTAQVTMAVPPTAPALVTNTVTTCSASVATFSIANAQTGFTYNWYAAATGGSAIATGLSFTTPPLSANTTYYAEAVNAGGCISPTRTAANVSITPLPQFTVQNTTVCPGSSATLSATATDANITFNWYATATGGTALFTGSAYTVSAVTTDTSYYVDATNTTTGCISPRQAVQASLLQPLPAPVVSVNGTTTNSVTFNWTAVSGAIAYLVSVDNGQSFASPSSGSAGLSNTVSGLQLDQAVTILVKALGASSCQTSENSASVTAKATSPADEIYVPNAFTPNGDGKNDVVHVHSEDIKSLSFYVYDQWGELLFSSTNMANGWDGSFKGAREPAGVYVYYLKAVMNNGSEVSKKGTITLLK